MNTTATDFLTSPGRLTNCNVEILLVSPNGSTFTTLEELAPVFEWMQPNMTALKRRINLLSADTVAGYVSVIEFHEDGSIYTLHNRIRLESL
jgi:hypothetical protein